MVGRQLFVGEKWSLREGQQYIYIYIFGEIFRKTTRATNSTFVGMVLIFSTNLF